VPASQRAGVLAQLRDLLANALAQDGGRFLTPYRFVRALKAGGIKATPTHNSGAVRLLTIHGAKGLEAHTVLMLDTDTGASRPESMGVLIDWPGEALLPRRFVFLASEKNPPACAASALALEQQARSLEELNALYVALTRAESRLVISSFEPHARGNATTWYERLLPLTQPLETPPEAAGRKPADTSTTDTFSLLALPALTHAATPRAAEPAQADDERTRIGLALHRLLQWHPTPARGFDWTSAHTQAVAREFALSTAQATQAQTMARRIVQGEAAWAWDGRDLPRRGTAAAGPPGAPHRHRRVVGARFQKRRTSRTTTRAAHTDAALRAGGASRTPRRCGTPGFHQPAWSSDRTARPIDHFMSDLNTMPSLHVDVAIVGGGPAGLMAAEVLSRAGLAVHLFDAMPSVGRKFLLAGKGGLNLTHAEPLDDFVTRYGTAQDRVQALLQHWGASAPLWAPPTVCSPPT